MGTDDRHIFVGHDPFPVVFETGNRMVWKIVDLEFLSVRLVVKDQSTRQGRKSLYGHNPAPKKTPRERFAAQSPGLWSVVEIPAGRFELVRCHGGASKILADPQIALFPRFPDQSGMGFSEVFPPISRPIGPFVVAEALPDFGVESWEASKFLRDELKGHQVVSVQIRSHQQQHGVGDHRFE